MQQTTIEQLEKWVQQAFERYEKNGETYYCGKSDALNDVLLKIRELKVVAPVAEGAEWAKQYFEHGNTNKQCD